MLNNITNLPSVGSRVRVTTRHRDIYYFSDKEYIEYNYVGEVLPSPKWIEHNSFILSGNKPDIDFHVISANNVVSIEYISGEVGREVDNSTQIFKVKSYTVFKSKSNYRCTCVGFQFHKKCKHIKEVMEKQ